MAAPVRLVGTGGGGASPTFTELGVSAMPTMGGCAVGPWPGTFTGVFGGGVASSAQDAASGTSSARSAA